MSTMPRLTVSMPARNSARFIREAIESVLCQKGVTLELFVIDDASEDCTAAVVESFVDPRLCLIRNETACGTGYCHNLAIEKSEAPFIAHVDSHDILVPGALAKMVAKLESDERLGQVHCFDFGVDADGEITRDAFRERRRALLALHRNGMDYKRQLLVLGMVANHLRTYRREVFNVVGRFDESSRYGEDYEMSLRIADAFDIAVVPELLYGYRVHGANASVGERFAPLLFWWQRLGMLRRAKRSGAVRFLREPGYPLGRSMIVGLGHILGISHTWFARLRWRTSRRGIRGALAEAGRPTAERLYYWAVDHLSWWPLDWLPGVRTRARGGKRIAAHLWRFPTLSETFIRRELTALVEQGYEVRVLARGPADIEFADDEARALLPSTEFLNPIAPEQLAAYRRYFFRKIPITYLNTMLYVIFHRYDYWKTFAEDRNVFQSAVYLAGKLKDGQINHVHAPWADRCAFVALVAARLAGVTCTVQARAHELHRNLQQYALREKFAEADAFITNCKYNEAFIQRAIGESAKEKLHTIYEGVDLSRFEPKKSWNLSSPMQILCVARIDEQKGLDTLLRACAALRTSGLAFRCDVIGGRELRQADYLLSLEKLHRVLDLGAHVHFLGAQPSSRVREAYAKADMFVLPCVVASDGSRDITPNALIEAMAMQLPVVSTRLSGIPEIVEEDVSGLLVPPGDADALSEAITTLAGNSALRARLGRNARMRVEERFDLTQNIRHFTSIFRSMAL